jgi:leader peptidase (prepilin peptidase)/N-methyltransferase
MLPTTIVVILLGWLAGCLINYLADVLPIRRRISAPFCLECNARQEWRSYLIWPRRCQACGRRRAWRVWGVEALMAAATLWLWLKPPEKLGFAGGLLLLTYFGLIIIIDVEHRLILHPVSLSGAAIGLPLGIWAHGWQATLLGGLAGFCFMLVMYWLGELMMRISARWRQHDPEEEALGFGDVNLGGVLGFILGWPAILVGLALAILLAGLASLFYIVIMLASRRYHPALAIPYGPFLVAGAVILIFFKDLVLANFYGIF